MDLIQAICFLLIMMILAGAVIAGVTLFDEYKKRKKREVTLDI